WSDSGASVAVSRRAATRPSGAVAGACVGEADGEGGAIVARVHLDLAAVAGSDVRRDEEAETEAARAGHRRRAVLVEGIEEAAPDLVGDRPLVRDPHHEPLARR